MGVITSPERGAKRGLSLFFGFFFFRFLHGISYSSYYYTDEFDNPIGEEENQKCGKDLHKYIHSIKAEFFINNPRYEIQTNDKARTEHHAP